MQCPAAVPQENQEEVKDRCLKPKSPEGVELSHKKRRRKTVENSMESRELLQQVKSQALWRPTGKNRPGEKTWEHLHKTHGQTI